MSLLPAAIDDNELSPARKTLLDRIHLVWIFVNGSTALSLFFLFLFNFFSGNSAWVQMLILSISSIGSTGILWYTNSKPVQWRLWAALISSMVALLEIALFFQNGYLIAISVTSVVSIYAVTADRHELITWSAVIGVIFTIIFAILNGVEQTPPKWLNDLHLNLLISKVLVPAFIGGGIVMIALLLLGLSNTLRQSLNEANERRRIAEEAQASQAKTLAQVERQAAEQARLLELVRDLETPVIPVLDGVLVLPIVGHLESKRLENLTELLLNRVSQERAHTVLLDITAVSVVDTATAQHLIQLARAIRLLGAECVITGIRAHVASTLVALGITWEGLRTAGSLRDGIAKIIAEKNIAI